MTTKPLPKLNKFGTLTADGTGGICYQDFDLSEELDKDTHFRLAIAVFRYLVNPAPQFYPHSQEMKEVIDGMMRELMDLRSKHGEKEKIKSFDWIEDDK